MMIKAIGEKEKRKNALNVIYWQLKSQIQEINSAVTVCRTATSFGE